MPIYIRNDIKIYHAHIPKCAGSSIENFFIKENFEYAFLDRYFTLKNKKDLWNKSSPQHLLAYQFNDLFYNLKFNFTFAIVRNPIDRFVSAFIFNFQRKHIQNIEDINQFIDSFYQEKKFKNFYLDNHFLPMKYFIENIPNIKIYKLENGLINLKKDLIEVLKEKDMKINFEKNNIRKDINEKLVTLNTSSISKLNEMYKMDFENFNY